jgi:hypothetical protein
MVLSERFLIRWVNSVGLAEAPLACSSVLSQHSKSSGGASQPQQGEKLERCLTRIIQELVTECVKHFGEEVVSYE